MAKCIKNKKTKEIIKVSDIKADKLVKENKWEYTSKSEYKRYITQTK